MKLDTALIEVTILVVSAIMANHIDRAIAQAFTRYHRRRIEVKRDATGHLREIDVEDITETDVPRITRGEPN